MGADLLIRSIGLKANERHLLDEEWARSAIAKATQAIGAIDETKLAEVNAAEGDTYADLDEYKQTLGEDLAEVQAAVFGERRDTARVAGGGGVILLLSGGLSWGDSPTELFECMSRLVEADVFPDVRWEEKT